MNIDEMVSRMTLEEKAAMCSGEGYWYLHAVERLGLPPVMVSDGPHGLRKQAGNGDHLGLNESVDAVCFPSAAGTASSFDRALLYRLGQVLGDEAQAEELGVILGPGVNIKRSPLCGRNFEYFSEDPFLAGEIAAAYIQGVQSKDVGTSLKHFAVNNQENRRMTSSSELDERTLREIYLAGFETAVKTGKPWTVMCSYNRINGIFASESHRLLTEILRDEWGFDGYVVSDWGAVNDRLAGLKAGMDLEMPSSGGTNDRAIQLAVEEGRLDEAVLDETVRRILRVTYRYLDSKRPETPFDRDVHHEIAREIARECMVLLKNDGILPLQSKSESESGGPEDVAFIGLFAASPRYQGGGSSHISARRMTSALDAAAAYARVSYAQGYITDKDETDEALLQEAVQTAKNAQIAVVFAGLPDAFESEGYDRTHMRLPACQNRLITEILKVQKNVVVVLHNGSPVEMPWVGEVRAILECYLGGEAVGGAAADILFGKANPSGKLAETFPLRMEDNPSYLNFPGDGDRVEYREGLYVGYRWYDSRKMDVLFPFGHGLSYTTFAYSGLTLDKEALTDTDTLTVTFRVKNTGTRAGKEAAQLYVRDRTGAISRPEKELKGFCKVALEPGEEKSVTITLDKRAFAFYDVSLAEWRTGTGAFDILVGPSSRDVPLQASVQLRSTTVVPYTATANTTCGDALRNPKTAPILKALIDMVAGALGSVADPTMLEMIRIMLDNLPLRSLRSFTGGGIDNEKVQDLVDKMNDALNS